MALDKAIKQIQLTPQQYKFFIVKKISRTYISRGFRTKYILGIKNITNKLLKYRESFKNQPFEPETDALGEELMEDISNERKKVWQKTLEEIDIKQKTAVKHGDSFGN
jgi:hypothetical protein